MIQLGERYRDTITGFEGVATARFEYLHGCVRWNLTGVVNGEPKDFSFDEPQLEPVPTVTPTRTTGGPRPTPPRTGVA